MYVFSFIVLFKFSIFVLIFCLDIIPIIEVGYWFPLIIMVLPIYPFSCCFKCLGILLFRCVYVYNCYVFLMDWSIYTVFVLCNDFCLKIYFIWYLYSRFVMLIFGIIWMEYLFWSIHFQCICVEFGLKWVSGVT